MKKLKNTTPKQKVTRPVYEDRYFPKMMKEAFEEYFCELVFCHRGVGDFYAGASSIEELLPFNKNIEIFNTLLRDFTEAYKYDENLDVDETMSKIIETHKQELESYTLFIYGGYVKDGGNYEAETDFEDLWTEWASFDNGIIEGALTNIAIAIMPKKDTVKTLSKRKTL